MKQTSLHIYIFFAGFALSMFFGIGMYDVVIAEDVTVNATVPAICGNGAVEGAEQCDGAALNNATCVTRGFDQGALACAANCTFDVTNCENAGGPGGNPGGGGDGDGDAGGDGDGDG
ncbi:MAG: hypothetical protein COU33_04095, partial [Candidatus Magasanikbacteria bacterium CG10_big_fil_rev_8_21_14_0_10_43_6]